MTSLNDLIQSVEQGEGADREIDIAVWQMFFPAPEGKVPLPWLHCYTTSLDAVVSLIEQKMPGWFGDVDICAPTPFADGLYGARLFRPDEKSGANISGEAKSPARALLAAFLRAYHAQKEQGQ